VKVAKKGRAFLQKLKKGSHGAGAYPAAQSDGHIFVPRGENIEGVRSSAVIKDLDWGPRTGKEKREGGGYADNTLLRDFGGLSVEGEK